MLGILPRASHTLSKQASHTHARQAHYHANCVICPQLMFFSCNRQKEKVLLVNQSKAVMGAATHWLDSCTHLSIPLCCHPGCSCAQTVTGSQQTALAAFAAFAVTVRHTHHIWETQSLLKNFVVSSSAYAHRTFWISVVKPVHW